MTSSETFKALKMVVIVPTYNNERTLTQVLDDLLVYTEDIILVNDGSTDATSQLLESYRSRLHVLEYHPNKGKGYALKTGFRFAVEKGFRYALTIDSDGQHYTKDLSLFLEEVENHPDALIIGSRPMKTENMPDRNTFANKFSNFWFHLQTGNSLPDTQSGFRVYPLHLMGKMLILTNRYEAELELLVFSAWRGIEVRPLPISVYYAPANEKVSHFRPFQDFTRISFLNTFLTFTAFVYGYPSMLIRKLIKK
jgi:glycosyltransferase involved in cell wall biosynthesis